MRQRVAFLGIVLIVIGLALGIASTWALIARRSIMSSELAKMGGGLRSLITKEGIHHRSGSFDVSDGAYISGKTIDGVPITGETRKIIP
jgi:cobalamin synthase